MSMIDQAIDVPRPLKKPGNAAGSAPRPRAPRRRRRSALCLWWELIAGPGPRWLRLLRWAQRNCRD